MGVNSDMSPITDKYSIHDFQLGATATGGAYIHIPGSANGEYGGGVLSDDGTTTVTTTGTGATEGLQDTTGGTVRAQGQLFHVQVNTGPTTDGDTTGFHLNYNQVPCDTSTPLEGSP